MRNLRGYLLASAAFACVGAAAGPANAQIAEGAGATFPSVVYRSIMDCLFNQVQGSAGKPGPQAKSSACPAFNASGFGGVILYAPTGSGNGKATLLSNLPATIGVPNPLQTVPYTDSTVGITTTAGYDGVQFAGSDDVVNSADMANWNAAGNPAKFGNLIQIPALVGPVGIGFNGTDGTGAPLTLLGSTPTGGTTNLNLSRHALCGIFSGHITQWNNAVLTTLNGGVTAMGTGNITVVHRSDGSGTNFLLTNALATQCQFEFGPNNESDASTVSWAFPWTDKSPSACPFPVAHGANLVNWPDTLVAGKDQCGNTVAPGAGHYLQNTGSGGVESTVATQIGSIGYASPDFWFPIKGSTAPKTANLQSQWDITAVTGAFQPMTFAGAVTAMNSVTPVFDSTTILNPLAWSLQGVVPNPALPGSYPIAGFTWLEMYQCYQPHANGINALTWFRIFINYLYGGTDAHNMLNVNGFGSIPFPWLQQASNLLSDPVHGPNFVASSTGCTGKVGAY
jgi:phosphate transport system substrate-binding protein